MSGDSIVSVFWDYENCHPPTTMAGYAVADRIREAAQSFGTITSFKAYMDAALESLNARSILVHADLQQSGVSIVHCPHNDRKDVVDKMMMVDMMLFALDSKSPATIFLITGDCDFTYCVSMLRTRGFRIILAAPEASANGLKLRADEVLDWSNDVLGISPHTVLQSTDVRHRRAESWATGVGIGRFDTQRLSAALDAAANQCSLYSPEYPGPSLPPLNTNPAAVRPTNHGNEARPIVFHRPTADTASISGSSSETRVADVHVSRTTQDLEPPTRTRIQFNDGPDAGNRITVDRREDTRKEAQNGQTVSTHFVPTPSSSANVVPPHFNNTLDSRTVCSDPEHTRVSAYHRTNPGTLTRPTGAVDLAHEQDIDLSVPDGVEAVHRPASAPPSALHFTDAEEPNQDSDGEVIGPGISHPTHDTDDEVLLGGQTDRLDDDDDDVVDGIPASCSIVPDPTDDDHISAVSEPTLVQPQEVSVARFKTLIDVLVDFIFSGNPRPIWSQIAPALVERNPLVYQEAGVARLKEYMDRACIAGVVTIGDHGLREKWATLNLQDIPACYLDFTKRPLASEPSNDQYFSDATAPGLGVGLREDWQDPLHASSSREQLSCSSATFIQQANEPLEPPQTPALSALGTSELTFRVAFSQSGVVQPEANAYAVKSSLPPDLGPQAPAPWNDGRSRTQCDSSSDASNPSRRAYDIPGASSQPNPGISPAPIPKNQPKDPRFVTLVQILLDLASETSGSKYGSLHQEILKREPMFFQRAGTSNLKEYLELARSEGIVELTDAGGKECVKLKDAAIERYKPSMPLLPTQSLMRPGVTGSLPTSSGAVRVTTSYAKAAVAQPPPAVLQDNEFFTPLLNAFAKVIGKAPPPGSTAVAARRVFNSIKLPLRSLSQSADSLDEYLTMAQEAGYITITGEGGMWIQLLPTRPK